jgi:hypothetical protein
MGTLGLVLFIVLFAGGISWSWVRGIDNMKKNHPDYKGEDFLNWDNEDVTKTAGRDGWDDNLVHTEGGF